ncbi:sortase [Salibacterium salarium]|uniref:Sortase n=1 Tax=Salibacterium salarium TaxID=284579 RepID=A0A428MT79_9BACI|nr:class D sortase [Salibacterium salarium]RSL29345.1 sortase [Salibacterium salarium]
MKQIGNLLIILGIVMIGIFAYQYWNHHHAQQQAMIQAEEQLQNATTEAAVWEDKEQQAERIKKYQADDKQAFGTLEIPKLDRTIPIVEGADEESLKSGVGHVAQTRFPGQGNQIVLSGHRDTVFRDFGKMETGDRYIIEMPYGAFEYEIKKEEIVPAGDTSIIGESSEEVLIVSTCYPFDYVGFAPERYVTYAYPVH